MAADDEGPQVPHEDTDVDRVVAPEPAATPAPTKPRKSAKKAAARPPRPRAKKGQTAVRLRTSTIGLEAGDPRLVDDDDVDELVALGLVELL